MRISHVAIWAHDLELMKDFYVRYFNCSVSDMYVNPAKSFSSYFLQFDDNCQVELMNVPNLLTGNKKVVHSGFAHVAISVGSKENVDKLTDRIARDGYTVIGQPRYTGDGFYESVVLDPEGNRIELTE